MMRKLATLLFLLGAMTSVSAQKFAAGVETYYGMAHTTFRGNLPEMVGFSELAISESDVNGALAYLGIDAPQWLKRAFYNARIEVKGDVTRQITRPVKTVRFFARYHFMGGSFVVSDPRLAIPQESKKLKNQIKSVRLALAGEVEELATHLAIMAAIDETRVKPFFNNRYDIEIYIDVMRLLKRDAVLMEWGKNSSVELNLSGGMRFTADPSPVLDLGSILFVSQRLDELMEGGIFRAVENTTDKIAVAVQNVVFGKFRDPRVVPSVGWFVRSEVPVNFGRGFSLSASAELSLQNHTAIKGTQPMFSAYGYGGIRWGLFGR